MLLIPVSTHFGALERAGGLIMSSITTQPLQASQSAKPAVVPRRKLFVVLYAAGLLGVLSLLLLSVSADTVAMTGLPENVVRLVTVVQPAILLLIAVVVGVLTAPSVGLRAPAVEAWLSGQRIWTALKPQLLPGLLGGIVVAVSIALYGVLQLGIMPELASQDAAELPLLTRLLYGGVTEELLLRWGFMSLLLWVGWRVIQRGTGRPSQRLVWAAIIIAALLFGLGHLPAAAALGILTPLMGVLIVLFNMVAGIVFGWLFARHGLGSAMMAHASAHLLYVLLLLPLVRFFVT